MSDAQLSGIEPIHIVHFQNFPSSQSENLSPVNTNTHPPPSPGTHCLLSDSMGLAALEPHVSGITQYLSFVSGLFHLA